MGILDLVQSLYDLWTLLGHLEVASSSVLMKGWPMMYTCMLSCPSSLQRFSWFNQSSDVVSLYVSYLTSLLSAQTCYLRSILQRLVSQLWLPIPQSADSVDDNKVYLNIHRAIRAILELIPTAPSLLVTLLTKHFPFKGKSSEIQVSRTWW